ncbi:MAG TPA: hypothetical protein VJ919_13200 [Tangfeifania sp.]|nr:hypothetical protein [Tangfeifania sp.]
MESNKYYNLVPSIGGSFSYGWRTMFGKPFLTLLLAVIIAGLLNGPFGANWQVDNGNWMDFVWAFPFAIFGLAYGLLFIPVINYGEKFLFLKGMRGEDADLKYLFDGFKNKYLQIVLANLIVWALMIIGFILLIVPGIIVACRLAFVPYLVMDKNLEAMQAVEKSWHMTKGHGWKVFWMGVLSIFIFIAGIIAFLVGTIISFMWIHSAFASLYQSVLNQSEDENPIPILGVNEA